MGQQRQIVAENVDTDGKQHKRQTYPESPIVMRSAPVRRQGIVRPFVRIVNAFGAHSLDDVSSRASYLPARAALLHLAR